MRLELSQHMLYPRLRYRSVRVVGTFLYKYLRSLPATRQLFAFFSSTSHDILDDTCRFDLLPTHTNTICIVCVCVLCFCHICFGDSPSYMYVSLCIISYVHPVLASSLRGRDEKRKEIFSLLEATAGAHNGNAKHFMKHSRSSREPNSVAALLEWPQQKPVANREMC